MAIPVKNPLKRISSYSFSPEIVLHSLFTKYDEDNDDLLNEAEFSNMLKNDLGFTTDESEVYWYLLDKRGDMTLSFEDVKKWYDSNDDLRNVHNNTRFGILLQAIELFKKYDLDHNYALDRTELKKVMDEFNACHASVDVALNELDLDHNGRISFVEFLNWLRWIPLADLFPATATT